MPELRWLTPDEQRVWRGYLRMNATLTAELNRRMYAADGLSGADFAVLVELTDRPDARARVFELVRGLQWEKSRLSHQLSRMQRRGLVERTESPDDGRGAIVAITPKGRAAIEQAAPRHVEAVRSLFFDRLTSDQVAALGVIADDVLRVACR